MAVPQSWSSGVLPARSRRFFTVEEANRSLPLVRRVMSDIVRAHEEAAHLHARLENRSNPQQRMELETGLEKAVDRLTDLVEELRSIGCDIKDYRMGLVDFPGKHEGREICLCWRLGEERIDFWHELHAGFAGRQPIETLA